MLYNRKRLLKTANVTIESHKLNHHSTNTMVQTLRILALLMLAVNCLAQRVSGIWSGKIIRQNDTLYASQNLEIQMQQEGKKLTGVTYSFNDSTQYVRMRMQGTINKRKDELNINEFTRGGYFRLPKEFFPCVKNFELKYSRIGNDQYLVGVWDGWNAFSDSVCFPGQTLLVYLRKVKKSEFKIEDYVKKDIEAYRKVLLEEYMRKKDSLDLVTLKKNTPITIRDSTDDDAEMNSFSGKDETNGLDNKREATVTTLILVPEQKVTLELYDNGEVDDDTVSVFINKKPVIVRQRLSAKPLMYEFVIGNPNQPLEILMQAENLGSIPPNTGKMIIKAGTVRREIDLSSDFKKSAAILVQYEKH